MLGQFLISQKAGVVTHSMLPGMEDPVVVSPAFRPSKRPDMAIVASRL